MARNFNSFNIWRECIKFCKFSQGNIYKIKLNMHCDWIHWLEIIAMPREHIHIQNSFYCINIFFSFLELFNTFVSTDSIRFGIYCTSFRFIYQTMRWLLQYYFRSKVMSTTRTMSNSTDIEFNQYQTSNVINEKPCNVLNQSQQWWHSVIASVVASLAVLMDSR